MLKKLTIPKGWKNGAVGDLVKGIRGVTFSSEDILSSDEPSAVVVLRSNNIKDSRINFEEVYLLPSTNVSEHQIAQPGDVAVCMSNGSRRLVGKAARFTEAELKRRVSVGAFCALFRPTTDADINFVPYLFDTESYRRELDITLAGSAINNLKNSDIEGIKIPLPPLAEQRKIAEIIRTWDEAIETAEAELKAKQERKRWLMEKLLTPSAEGAGALRVAGINYTLKRVRIKDVAELDPETLGESTDPGLMFKYIDLSSVTGGRIGEQVELMTFAMAPGRARKLVKEGDVLLGMVRPYLKPFAKVQRALDGHVASTGFAVIRAKSGIADPEYLYQTIWADGISKQIHQTVTGSNYPALSAGDVKDLKITLPPLAAQRKISEILQDADVDIELINKRIEDLRSQKRGLMQKLLTGEVRVAA